MFLNLHRGLSSKTLACFLVTAISGSMAGRIAAGATPGGAENSEKLCITVLAPEVVGKISPDERKALAGQLDTLLTESLARQKGFVAVDRQALDKVLAERTATAGGLTKIAPKDVAASLKPFFASGILICPAIHKDKQGKIIVSVEAVLAQTGQLLAELHKQGVWQNGRWTESPKVVENMARFWRDVQRNITRNTSLLLVEVSGKLTSKLTRLQWMVDDLGDAASARVALAPNAIPLVPRHPLNTKEERLLRVMGLSAAKAGDTAAGLRPTSDVRLLMELGETVKTGVSFAKTPIRLKLALQRAKAPAITTEIKSEAGKWETCRKEALAWIDTHVRGLSNGGLTAKIDEEARARKMAREELAAVGQWTGGGYWQQRDMDTSIRLLIVRKALRAAHLDPTNEKAAYLVAIHVDALYAAGGQEKTLACYDRVIAESLRYLDRFGQKVVPHHRGVQHLISSACVKAQWHIQGGAGPKNAILRKPNVRLYPYVRVDVRVLAERGYLAETDKRYAITNAFAVFGLHVAHYLIPHCPDELLDEEYAYWRNWWKTKVEKVVHDKGNTNFTHRQPVPWCLVEAAFQARKKNPRGVRAALQQMADKYPKSHTRLWGGDQYKTYQVPVYLRAAGDPEWKTWQPQFQKAEPIKISLGEMTSFISGLKPRTPAAWPLSNLSVIPVTEMVVPRRVRETGRARGSLRADVDGVLPAGDDIWLITPGTSIAVEREINNLFVARVGPARNRKILLDPVAIAWPEQTADKKHRLPGKPILTCSYVTGDNDNPTMWLGTKAHGLARFDKVGGKWIGRWYTMRNGTPTNGVTRISTCRSDGKQLMLLVDQRTYRIFPNSGRGPQTVIWTLDPDTGDMKLLFDGSKGSVCIVGNPAGRLADGRKVILDLLGEGVYGNVDIKDVTKIIESECFSGTSGGALPVTRESGKPGTTRIWANGLEELSLDTLKPMRSTSPGRGGRQLSIFPIRVMKVSGVLGAVYWRYGTRVTIPDRWPGGSVVLATGRRDMLWLAVKWGGTSGNGIRRIVGYRPAPKGSKDWAKKDRWFGPFRPPARSGINRMVPYGENGLLLSTGTGVYRVDCAEAVAQAERSGRACSTAEWRKQYEKRLAKAGWQSLVPKLILDKRWDDALKLLDDRQKQLGTITKASPRKNRDEWMRLLLWRAHVNAKKPGGIAKAIECYDRVGGSGFVGHAGEVFARMNQILMLHKARRWREMLDLCEKVTTRFPQTKPMRKSSRLNWYINDARQNLKKASKEKTSKEKS